MTTSEWVLSILTTVLVIATIYYAVQTYRLVDEMRKARELQVRPKLIPAIQILGPNDFYPKVVNAGAGPAIDLEVAFALEPSGPSGHYAAPFMTPGHGAGVFLKAVSGRMTNMDEYRAFPTLRMKAGYSDVLGSEFVADETFDLGTFVEGFKSGMWARLPGISKEGEPLKLIADAVVNIEFLMRMDRESN